MLGWVVLITHFLEGITGFGCTVLALAAENRSLEEVFLALTEKKPEQEAPAEGEEN